MHRHDYLRTDTMASGERLQGYTGHRVLDW
jgi:hypothetical protein